MGDYKETGAGHCNKGLHFFLLGLCKEMPWMFNEPTTAIKEFYAQIGYEKGLDEFILKALMREYVLSPVGIKQPR